MANEIPPGVISYLIQERMVFVEMIVLGAGCATVALLMALIAWAVVKGKEME